MTSDQSSQMSASWSMNKSTKYIREQAWLILDRDINWHISIENSSTKQRTTFMLSDPNTQMRRRKNVKCTTFRRTSGSRYVTWRSQGITTLSRYMMVATSTLLAGVTQWMRRLWSQSRDLMVTQTYKSRNGSQCRSWTKTMLGLHVIHLDHLHSMIQRSWSLVEIMAGSATASTSTLRPTWFSEWTNAA